MVIVNNLTLQKFFDILQTDQLVWGGAIRNGYKIINNRHRNFTISTERI